MAIRKTTPPAASQDAYRLHMWLERKGVTDTELAKMLEVSRQRVSYLRVTPHDITPELKQKIARLLGTKPGYIWRAGTTRQTR